MSPSKISLLALAFVGLGANDARAQSWPSLASRRLQNEHTSW